MVGEPVPDVTGWPAYYRSFNRSAPERPSEKFERIVGVRLYQVNTRKIKSNNHKLLK
jgi:hypothetical protein